MLVPGEGRSGFVLGLLSGAAWLGSFLAWLYTGSFLLVLLLILAGIVLAPVAAIVSIGGLLEARQSGEPIWPAVTGLLLSLPPVAFITYAAIWGLIYD